jgi:hypothetical protein
MERFKMKLRREDLLDAWHLIHLTLEQMTDRMDETDRACMVTTRDTIERLQREMLRDPQ